MSPLLILSSALLLVATGRAAAKFSCLNEKGEPVPWFIGYKIPKDTEYKPLNTQRRRLWNIEMGVQSMFMDPGRPAGKFVLSDKKITDDSGHHLAETLKQMYGEMPENHFSLMFNDEIPPKGRNSTTTYGNTKGMVLFDDEQGFWLMHSVPAFAPADAYRYPPAGAIYGQSYICVTFGADQLDQIAGQLAYTEPYVYSSRLSPGMAGKFPSLSAVKQPQLDATEAPHVREVNLTSVDGTVYRHFAKSRAYGKDIYSEEHGIAKSLDRQIEIQSWRQEDLLWKEGKDFWPACDDWAHMTLDVERYLTFHAASTDGKSSVSLKWRTYNDNSKWLVTLGREKNNYLCIADINRQEDQTARGGGVMCVENKDLKFPYARSSLDQNTCT